MSGFVTAATRMRVYVPPVLGVICAGIVAACQEPTAPTAAVRFYLDAPLCVGSQIPLQFSIDAEVVGQETLMDGDTTRAFATSVGTHVLRARLNGAAFDEDTTVALGAGEEFVMRLDFYCS